MPTLNAFDNGDVRTTIVVLRMREGKPGGGKGPMMAEDKTFTIATANDQVIFHPHYHDGARVQGDTMNTLTSRMGTGGNNVSMIAKGTTVRRLTPVECERLQGFPDDWTSGQSDSARYKQMGNAVAVPVVEWIMGNLTSL